MPPIYLDYNATTPVAPEVVDAMLPYLRDFVGNASSAHAYGAVARETIEGSRRSFAEQLNAPAESIVFTAGGTESNNLSIEGLWRAHRASGGTRNTNHRAALRGGAADAEHGAARRRARRASRADDES